MRKVLKQFFLRRLTKRLKRAPYTALFSAQTRAAQGPVAPFRSDLSLFGKRFIRYDYRLACVSPSPVNLGDFIQSDATEQAIRQVVEGATFQPWLRSELSWYDREPAVCVMQGWYETETLNFLPNRRVLPVWIGTHFSRETRESLELLLSFNRDLFRDQVFGCRDLSTLRWCREQGLEAYFSRCLTLSLPRVVHHIDQDRESVFVVGPQSWRNVIMAQLPTEWREQVVQTDHYEDVPRSLIPADAARDLELARARLAAYREKARLVITNRIHCAQPCATMGIPTVFIVPTYDEEERFSTLQGILPIWTLRDWTEGRVNLTPKAPDLTPLRSNLLENLRLSILAARGEPVDVSALEACRNRIATFRA